MENDVVTKSELKQIQLIAKLEDTVEVLTNKLKQRESEKENLQNKLDEAKLKCTKLEITNSGIEKTKEELLNQVSTLKAELKTDLDKQKDTVANNPSYTNETELQLNEKIIKLEKELSEAKNKIIPPTPRPTKEELVRLGLDEQGRIHSEVLEYILKKPVEHEEAVGSLLLRKVYLGNGFYQIQY